MTQEDKQLLLQDLCARLPYGVKATTTSNGWNGTYDITGYVDGRIYLDCPIYDEGDDEWMVESVKPYLRPMSSMTEEEKEIYKRFCDEDIRQLTYVQEVHPSLKYKTSCYRSIDWLNEHHFDYRGLIEKGLALEAPVGMYNFKTE